MRKKKQPTFPDLPESPVDDLLGKNTSSHPNSEIPNPQRKRLEDLDDSL